jgi:hypothetical protein
MVKARGYELQSIIRLKSGVIPRDFSLAQGFRFNPKKAQPALSKSFKLMK